MTGRQTNNMQRESFSVTARFTHALVVTITPGDSTFRRFKIEFDLDNMNLFQPKSQYRIFLTPVDANDAIYEIRYTRPMK